MADEAPVAAVSAETAAPAPLDKETASAVFRAEFEAGLAEEGEAATESPADEPQGAAQAEQAEEGEDGTEAPAGALDVAEVRRLLKARDLEAVAKALGVDVADLGIDKREHQALRKARQRAEVEQEKAAVLRKEVEQERERTKSASAHFGRIADKYRAGDYTGAIEELFGADIGQVQRLVEEQHSDPTKRELLRMRRELEETKRADEESRKARETQELTAQQERQVDAYLSDVAEKIPTVAPKYSPLAKDRRFLRAVFDAQAKHFAEEGTHLPLGRAVRETAEKIRQSLEHWGTILSEGQNPQPSGGKSQQSARGVAQKPAKSVAVSQGGSGSPSLVTRDSAQAEWDRVKAELSRVG